MSLRQYPLWFWEAFPWPGGEGSVFPKAFAGVLILTVIENGLTMMGADIYLFQIAKALIIFVMMYIDSIKNKM